jgi:alkylation response protein AidB-like acyl-CoA dehydrogenase
MFPKTESQARLLEVAERLAAQFAITAAEHDRDGSFPTENFEAMHEAGYLAAAIPEEYGGPAHGLTDIVLAQHALAKGDGSTTLSVGMHLMTTGTEGSARSWPDEIRDRIFRDVVEHGTLVNNIAAEPEMGSPRSGGRPATVLQSDGPGRWRLSGRKTFSTLSPMLTYFITYCAINDGSGEDGSGDVGRVAVHRDRPGITIDETWDALGMRATGSHDVVFEDVPIEDGDIVGRRSLDVNREAMSGGGAWFPLLVGAANLGVSEAARDYAVNFARDRDPGGQGRLATIPYVREQIGRADAKLIAARTLLFTTAEDWEQHPTARAQLEPHVATAKLLATNTAVEVVEIAMRLVGGVALQRNQPLERYFRDVRGGLVNPPIDARAFEQIAHAALDGDEPSSIAPRLD